MTDLTAPFKNMENKSFHNGVQFAWDATSLHLAQTCLRKYQYKMIEGWTPAQVSAHLIFGSLYATALEHYHKHRANGLDYEAAVRSVVHEALIMSWEHDLDERGLRIVGTGQPWDGMDNLKTRPNLIRTIVWYLDHFKEDPMETIHLADGSAAVELSFTLEFTKGLKNDILYCGHLDRLVEYNGDLYVQDQKTTGSTVNPRYFEQWNPSTQMTGYTYAGKIIYNLPVKGVVIDAAQIAVGFSRFERGFSFRTEAQLEEWRDQSIYHISIAQEATRRGYFPMNLASCGNYGGCEFRRICSKSPEVRPQFLKADFNKGPTWDPLEQR